MTIPAKCSKCGYEFYSQSYHIENSTNVTIGGNNSESCPRCGGRAFLQSGTYDFVGTTIAAFRAPGVTKKSVERLNQIAKAVQAGEIDQSVATTEVVKINPSFATVWNWVNNNAGALSILLMIIAMFQAHYYWSESRDSSEADREASRRQVQSEQKIREELEKQTGFLEKLNELESTRQAKQQQTPMQKPALAGPNRHERRKAASLARKKK